MQQTTLMSTQISSPVSDYSPILEDFEKIDDIDLAKKEKKSSKPAFKPHQKFSLEDDTILRNLVAAFGESSWILIAEHMPGRNSRQCRERWLNYLSPKLNRQKFTQEEDELLLAKVEEIGTKWVTISKSFFPNRTDQMVKNRYYILKRKADKKNGKYHTRKNKNSKQNNPPSVENITNFDFPVPISDEKIINSIDYGLNIEYDINNENYFEISDDTFEQSIFGTDNFELHSF